MTVNFTQERVLDLLDAIARNNFTDSDLNELGRIIEVANVPYNNTSEEFQELPDSLYDEAVEVYNRLRPPVIGASGTLGKRMVDTEHKYPKLKGTLDKIKYTTIEERDKVDRAKQLNLFSFEKWLANRFDDLGLNRYEVVELGVSYKYDGVSVISETSTTILSALTRGKDNKGADVTDFLKHYKFTSDFIDKMLDITIGMKWEAIITYANLEEYNIRTGNTYKNPRSAIVGIFGRLDAVKFVDLITLVPIESSYDMDRNEEVYTINALFNTGIPFEYINIKGDYFELVKKFKHVAEMINGNRAGIAYMIDGLVIEFTDTRYRENLGRKDDINQFQVAYKFPDQERVTAVNGMTYSVGYTGKIVPKVHYDTIFFNGTTHDKTSLASFGKFKALNLSPAQKIIVRYSNDVICDVFNVEDKDLGVKVYAPYGFPNECPICNGDIKFTDDEATCINPECPAKLVGRIYNFVYKMGVKEWGDTTVQQLYMANVVKDIVDLFTLTLDDLQSALNEHEERLFGDVEAENLFDELTRMKEASHSDYDVLGSIGLTSIGRRKFEVILSKYTIDELLELSTNGELVDKIVELPGFAHKSAESIDSFLSNPYEADLIRLLCKELKIVSTKSTEEDKPVKGIITFTNFRDSDWEEQLISMGYKVDSFTKKTALLIHDGESAKVEKAKVYGIPTIARDSFTVKDVDSYIKG